MAHVGDPAALGHLEAQRGLLLAHALETSPETLGPRDGWLAEWKWDGIRAQLIKRGDLKLMRPGAVLVDVAIDQGGCFETSTPTTHQDPTYVVDGVVHYCVANMPGAAPLTSTYALSAATTPYVLALADKGMATAFADDPGFAAGLNVQAGEIRHPAVAASFAA